MTSSINRFAKPAALLFSLASALYMASAYISASSSTSTSTSAPASGPAVQVPPPVADSPKPTAATPDVETAVFAGGCFWGVEGVFERIKGVKQVLSGYSGGTKNDANYEKVSSGKTGHAESVQIHFDPKQISYGQLLNIFFAVAHNPTELDRQGPDIGKHYRSAIFYTTPDQQRVGQAYITQLNRSATFKKPIMTQLMPLKAFYTAENYHQDYMVHNPNNPYIVEHDLPKITLLKATFPDLYQETPASALEKNSEKK